MLEYGVGRFESWFADDRDEVVDADRFMDGAIEQLGPVTGHFRPAWVRVEDDSIAGREHADGVGREGGQRVSDRGDGANDAEGCVFRQRQTVVAGDGLCPQELDAGD